MARSKPRARAFRSLQMESLERRNLTAIVRDDSFGNHGVAAIAFGVLPRAGNATLQKDGKIVVVGGEGSEKRGEPERDLIVARFNPNGTLDKTFSDDGRVHVRFGLDASAVAVQDDGKIIDSSGSSVYRFNADGLPDETFGEFGHIFHDPYINVQDLDVLANGKIILVGYDVNNFGRSKVLVARLNSDGSPDTTFGNNGTTAGFKGSAYGMRLYDNGKILVSGGSDAGRMLLIRYNANGTVDTTFGNNGQAQVLFNRGGVVARDPMILPSGKIIAAGSAYDSQNHYDFALARFTANGKLDTTFGNQGKVITPLGGYAIAYNVRSQPHGGILVTGSRTFGTFGEISDAVMVRYLPGGRLDPSFGGTGKIIFDFGGNAAAPAIAQASGGRITIAGNKDD